MGIAKEMESTVDSHEVQCPKTEIGQATAVQPAYVPSLSIAVIDPPHPPAPSPRSTEEKGS